MTALSYRDVAFGIALGVSATLSLQIGRTAKSPAQSPHAIGGSVIKVHLASYEVTPDGTRILSSPVQRALMEFDCVTNRYRRLGADVERPDGVVMILGENEAGQDWRSAKADGPEFLQIRASCAARR